MKASVGTASRYQRGFQSALPPKRSSAARRAKEKRVAITYRQMVEAKARAEAAAAEAAAAAAEVEVAQAQVRLLREHPELFE